METNDNIILVTGATGRQGGAVVKHLLERGWQIRALTRDPDQPKAQSLADMGVEVLHGNLETITPTHSALRDLYGIFSVQTREEGVESEVRQGCRLADMAILNGVHHFVYSSVGGADRRTGIPHFETKWRVEEHIRKLDLPWTILRPVFFMDNFSSSEMQSQIKEGKLPLAMDPGKPLQMIAVDDIGAFAAMAFDHPKEYMRKSIEIAGDELTIPQAAHSISQVTGRNVEFVQVPIEDLYSSSPEMAAMFEWFNREGYRADISHLRTIYPDLMNFETWLHRADWVRQMQEEEAVTRR